MAIFEHKREAGRAHALFSPSSSPRVTSCPASLALHTDQGTSEEAAEGTVAHFLHERVLRGELLWAHAAIGEEHVVMEGEQHYRFTVTQEMADAVHESTELVQDIFAEMERAGEEPVMRIEVKADISRWTPVDEQFGSSDVIIVGKTRLVVIDYKHGRGVKVDAENNTQLALYALGAYAEYEGWNDFETIDIRIHQPRMDNFPTWQLTPAELLAFGDWIAERFKLAIEPDAPFGPSEKACKFCGAKARCPALAKMTENLMAGVFDDLDAAVVDAKPVLPDFAEVAEARLLKADALSYLWKKKKLIEDYLGAVQTECEHRLLHGEPLPELKLVEGRSSRAWKDEIDARQKLEALGCEKPDIIKVVLVTPAQAEKLLPKPLREQLEPLIDKTPGRPTVALATDKRKEWKNPSTEAFDDLDADDSGL